MGAESLDISWIGSILRELGMGLMGPGTQIWPILVLTTVLIAFGVYRFQRIKD